MWTEIIQNESKKGAPPPHDISFEPIESYEVRLCVYETKDLKLDGGPIDGFVRAGFDNSNQEQETDTHYRNHNGACSFNYRLLLNFDHPKKSKDDYKLNIKTFDRELLADNRLIGEYQLDLYPVFEDSKRTVRPIQVSKDYYKDYLKAGETIEGKYKEPYWPKKKKTSWWSGEDPNYTPYSTEKEIEFEEKSSFWIPMMKKDKKG